MDVEKLPGQNAARGSGRAKDPEIEQMLSALQSQDILGELAAGTGFQSLRDAARRVSQEDYRLVEKDGGAVPPEQNMAKEKVAIDNELARIERELAGIGSVYTELSNLRKKIDARRGALKVNRRELEKRGRQIQKYLDSGKQSRFVTTLLKKKAVQEQKQDDMDARGVYGVIKYGDEKFLLERETVIGRERDCDIVLRDETVSRHHALIVRQDDRFWLIDTGSTNGVFLDGERIVRDSRVRLNPGAVIKMGDSFLTFSRL